MAVPICAVMLLLIATLAAPAGAAEYYSWIDPNGVMVMTDDPNRIPAPTERSRVEIHRFRDPAPGMMSSAGDDARTAVEGAASREPRAMESPPSAELPSVLLQPPDDPMRSQYVWVPLQQPLPIGGQTVTGYWWHPGVTSQIDAFKSFLRQHRLLADSGLPGIHGFRPFAPGVNPLPQSTNPFYDQVVRERQMLVQRAFPIAPFGARPPAASRPSVGALAPPHH